MVALDRVPFIFLYETYVKKGILNSFLGFQKGLVWEDFSVFLGKEKELARVVWLRFRSIS